MEPLPTEKNPGVYHKYNVQRTDGSSTEGHEYLVVRTDEGGKHQQAALEAACKFAQEIEDTDPELSESMWNRYRPEMDHKTSIVVKIPWNWGKGTCLEEAMRECVQRLGVPEEVPVTFQAFEGKDLLVNQYGGIASIGELKELDEEEVKKVFKEHMNSRFEQTLCDIDNFALMKGKGKEVADLTEKILEILGPDYGL